MTDSNVKPVIWTAREVASALGAATSNDWSATGVSIDSRTVVPGDLFVAIVGPLHDAHDFVLDALKNGAVGAVVHCDPEQLAPDRSITERLIRVPDTLMALETLAEQARQRSDARIIAVTGSVGKTGTKEILKLVLSEQGATIATQGNLNNQWGLPLSLARMPRETEFGIFEMGMNRAGEIAPLSKIARPDVALITTVEMVHSEFFESIGQIADSKAEIFTGLTADGVAVLNADNAMYPQLRTDVEQKRKKVVKTFGYHQDADFRLLSATSENNFCRADARINGHPVSFKIGIAGRHWALNALGALACVEAIGADVTRALRKLTEMRGLKGRGERHVLQVPGGAYILIDESYNASPVSMRAALEVLGQMSMRGDGRRIAVLGDMLELGTRTEQCHADLLTPLTENNTDLVFTTGQYMGRLWNLLPAKMRGGHAMTADKLLPLLLDAVRPGDVVSIKGSLGSNTGRIVSKLLELHGADTVRPTICDDLTKSTEGGS